MYELIFEAWARLLGFVRITGAGRIYWCNKTILSLPSEAYIYEYRDLLIGNIGIQGASTNDTINYSLTLANLMTHASMIIIFVFIIMFFVFLFRLVSGMLTGRR